MWHVIEFARKKTLDKELKVSLPNRLIPSPCDSEGC